MAQIIKVRQLRKVFKVKESNGGVLKRLFKPDYKDVLAVDSVDFDINEGESVAFLGPNGAGKTTTTKMLTGIIAPTSGEIDVLGFKPFDRNYEYLRQIGLVMGGKPGLNWHLSANQNLDLMKTIYQLDGIAYKKQLETYIDLLDTSTHMDTQLRKLSLGQRMKIEVIGSLIHSPKVIFLDEPTIGLDIVTKQKFRGFLREIQQSLGITILMTSHDIDDIESVCDRVLLINHGRLVIDEPINQLMKKYSREKYVKVSFNENVDIESNLQGLNVADRNGSIVTVRIPKESWAKVTGDLIARNVVADMDMVSTPLEEILRDEMKV